MAEYQHFDGETFITMDIISVNERKQEVEIAITSRKRNAPTLPDCLRSLYLSLLDVATAFSFATFVSS